MKYIAVTSRGEIILIDRSLNFNMKKTISDLWFNSLVVIEEYVYIVTAEGILLIYDMRIQKENRRIQLSRYQLIDITYDSKKDILLIASVEGELFEVKIKEYFFKSVLCLENIHFTSLSLDSEESICFISTLEGDIIKYSIEAKEILLTKRIQSGRIWKVSLDPINQKIALISTNKMAQVLAYDLTTVYHTVSKDELITTCLLNDGQLWLGNEKGEVFYFSLKKPNNTQVLHSKIPSNNTINDNFDFEKGVYLFFDKSCMNTTYKDRDIEILESSGISYIEVDVTDKDLLKRSIVQRSGWSKFPQILFWGKFISSASVISEMFQTKCLNRVVNNLRDGNVW